jgi:hypothetical protein
MVQATTQDKGGKNFAQQTAENIKNSWDKYKHYDAAAQKAQVEWWQDKWNATVDLTAKVTTGIVKNVSRATAEFHNGTQYFTKVAQESYAAARKQEGAYADGPESVNANNDKTYAASVNTDKSTMGSRNTQQAIAKPASASSASWSDKYVKGALQATGASLVGAGVGAGVASALTGASFGALALAAAPALGVVAGGVLLGLGVVKVAESASKLVQKLLGGLGMGPSRNSQAQFGPQARQGASDGRDYGTPDNVNKNNTNGTDKTQEPMSAAAQAVERKSLRALVSNIQADRTKEQGTIQKEHLEALVGLSPDKQALVLKELPPSSFDALLKQATEKVGINNPEGVATLQKAALQAHQDALVEQYTYGNIVR